MPTCVPTELGEIAKKLAALESRRAEDRDATEMSVPDDVIESTVTKYLEANAAELAAEKDKPFQPMPFQPLGMAHENAGGEAAGEVAPQAAAAAGSASADAAAGRSATAAAGKSAGPAVALPRARGNQFPFMRKGATARCRRFPSSTSRAGSRWRCAAARRTARS